MDLIRLIRIENKLDPCKCCALQINAEMRDVDFFLEPLASVPKSSARMNGSLDQTSVLLGVAAPSSPIQKLQR